MKIDKEKIINDMALTLARASTDEMAFDKALYALQEDRHMGEDMKKEICTRAYNMIMAKVDEIAPLVNKLLEGNDS